MVPEGVLDAVLELVAAVQADVLFLLNRAAGPESLAAAIGAERVLLRFPALGGTWDGEAVRYRPPSPLTRLLAMPFGEPDGRTTSPLERIVHLFRTVGVRATTEPRMDAWLKTHAAFEVPLGQAVRAAGGPEALAVERDAIRRMIHLMRLNLASLATPTVPRAFNLLGSVPEAILVSVFRGFLRSAAAAPLSTDTPAVSEELERLAEQLGISTPPRSTPHR
jgi:hypothetical protein